MRTILVLVVVALMAQGVQAGPEDATAQNLLASWTDGDPGMTAVAEVIASAFASGMSWASTMKGHPVYCPPQAIALTGNQVMSILESFVAANPETADKPYGFGLSASLGRAYPCAPG